MNSAWQQHRSEQRHQPAPHPEGARPATAAPLRQPPALSVYAMVTSGATGRPAFLAGQAPHGLRGGSAEQLAQARQCLQTLKVALAALGATATDIIQIKVHAGGPVPATVLMQAGQLVFGADWAGCARQCRMAAELGQPVWLNDAGAIQALTDSLNRAGMSPQPWSAN
jgi:enamine deaminase RidA (YjgF/YER057c/UK114 family)